MPKIGLNYSGRAFQVQSTEEKKIGTWGREGRRSSDSSISHNPISWNSGIFFHYWLKSFKIFKHVTTVPFFPDSSGGRLHQLNEYPADGYFCYFCWYFCNIIYPQTWKWHSFLWWKEFNFIKSTIISVINLIFAIVTCS